MDKIIKPNLTGTYLKKIRIYSYDKIYVVIKSSTIVLPINHHTME
jgi:hypothetical protein